MRNRKIKAPVIPMGKPSIEKKPPVSMAGKALAAAKESKPATSVPLGEGELRLLLSLRNSIAESDRKAGEALRVALSESNVGATLQGRLDQELDTKLSLGGVNRQGKPIRIDTEKKTLEVLGD